MTKEQELEKLVKYIKKEGLKVDSNMQRVLEYFSKYDVSRFLASGFGGSMASVEERVAKELNMNVDVVFKLTKELENIGLLSEQKGDSTPSGREYYYGLTPTAYCIMGKKQQYW